MRRNFFVCTCTVPDRCGHVEGEYVDLGEGTRQAVVHGRQARRELAPRHVDHDQEAAVCRRLVDQCGQMRAVDELHTRRLQLRIAERRRIVECSRCAVGVLCCRRILALHAASGGWWWRRRVCNGSRSVVCLAVLLGGVRRCSQRVVHGYTAAVALLVCFVGEQEQALLAHEVHFQRSVVVVVLNVVEQMIDVVVLTLRRVTHNQYQEEQCRC